MCTHAVSCIQRGYDKQYICIIFQMLEDKDFAFMRWWWVLERWVSS